jgi:hypothetical protein
MKTLLLTFLISVFSTLAFAQKSDSIKQVPKAKAHFRTSLRFHNAGQFQFGGRMVSTNPGMDVSFNYDHPKWGFVMFKAQDLVNSNTGFNFMLAAFNKNFKVGKRLTLTPTVGALLEQSHTFADYGSDVALIMFANYKLSKKINLEYATLFGNFVVYPEEKDWVNRLRLTYTHHHIDVILSGWHNNHVFDAYDYMTYSASVFYNRVKIADHLFWQAGVTCLRMPQTSDEKEYPTTNGLYFTTGITFAN